MTATPQREAPVLSSTEDTAGVSASVDAGSADAGSVDAEPADAGSAEAAEAPNADPPADEGIRWKTLLLGSIPFAVLGLLIFFEVPICPTRNLLGIPCPGCGLTRASGAMASGDFAAMLRFHPLAPIITPVVLFSVARVFLVHVGILKSNKDPLGRVPKLVWYAVGAALLSLWVARGFGLLGGLPDAIDLEAGWLYRGARFMFYDFWVAVL